MTMTPRCTVGNFSDLPDANYSWSLSTNHSDSSNNTWALDGAQTLRQCMCIQNQTVDHTWKFVQTIGPFNSTGGYDWHRIQWHSFASSHGWQYLASYEISVVDRNGVALGFPPINTHHIIVGEKPRMTPTPNIFKVPTTPYLIFHGADALHLKDQVSHVVYSPYAKKFQMPCLNTALLNDVRAASSPEMQWYLHLVMEFDQPWEGRKLNATLYIHEIYNPIYRPWGHDTFLVPAVGESVAFISGRWPFSGRLITDHTRLHTHQEAHQDTLLLEGEPVDFALQVNMSYASCVSSSISAVQWENNEQFLAFLLASSRMVCHARRTGFEVGGHSYGRASTVTCRDYVALRRGQPFTSIMLFKPLSNAERQKAGPEVSENELAMHSIWFIAFIAADERSALSSRAFYTVAPIETLAMPTLLAILRNETCLPSLHGPSWSDHWRILATWLSSVVQMQRTPQWLVILGIVTTAAAIMWLSMFICPYVHWETAAPLARARAITLRSIGTLGMATSASQIVYIAWLLPLLTTKFCTVGVFMLVFATLCVGSVSIAALTCRQSESSLSKLL